MSANSSADIVIQDYTVDKIINVLAVSRQTLMRAKAATLLGLSVTFAFTALAASGRLTPLTGAILQIITVLMTLLIAGRVSVSQTKK